MLIIKDTGNDLEALQAAWKWGETRDEVRNYVQDLTRGLVETVGDEFESEESQRRFEEEELEVEEELTPRVRDKGKGVLRELSVEEEEEEEAEEDQLNDDDDEDDQTILRQPSAVFDTDVEEEEEDVSSFLRVSTEPANLTLWCLPYRLSPPIFWIQKIVQHY